MAKKQKFTITNIDYDTDDSEDAVGLPKEIVVEVDLVENSTYEDVEHVLSEAISNETGFCHKGFAVTPEIKEALNPPK
jgi:hypothetical protein